MNEKDLALLSHLTIVMTTFDRPLELEQAIEYWRVTDVTLHILDGSLNPCFSDGLLTGTKSIYYHHLPSPINEIPLLNFFQRMVAGSELPKTKYSAVCPTDDFFTISGLVESIKCLEQNNKIDAVSGSTLHYRKTNKDIVWNFHHRVRLNYNSLEIPSIETRLNNKSTTWFLYAVCRSTIWKQYIRISYEIKGFSETQFYANEWIMFKLSKAMFRTKHLNTLTMVRQHTIKGANLPPKISWKDWLLHEQNKPLIEEIAGQLAKAFDVVTSAIDKENNLDIARRFMCQEQERLLKVQHAPVLGQRVRHIFAELIFKVFPDLNVFSNRPKTFDKFTNILESSGLEYDVRELENIIGLLTMAREEMQLTVNYG